MMEWFTELAQSLQGMPVLQAILAGLSTFILEDPTTVGCGLLVAHGKFNYWAAFIGLSLGIAGGDVGLYLIGRLAEGKVKSWKLLDDRDISAAKGWYDRNVVTAVLTARFVPGMRLPTYLAAGLLRVNLFRFALVAASASLIWTAVLLNLTVRLGEAVLDHTGRLKLPIGLGVVVLLAVIQMVIARRRRSTMRETADVASAFPLKSLFEYWPPVLFYFPVCLYCLYLSIRHRGLMLFTISNPTIYSGGMIMESKSGILNMVAPSHRRYFAPYTLFVRPGNPASPQRAKDKALAQLTAAGLELPVVAKPDVGQRSLGVRPIYAEEDLAAYMQDAPPGMRVILQKLAPYADEAGVLYYRKPDEEKGHIISLTIKCFPAVIGDGKSTLRELILADRRARITRRIFFRRHRKRLDEVLPEGERFQLVFVGAHAQGSMFLNGNEHISPELETLIDGIAKSVPEFYYGRFDIRCASIESLKRGEDFLIVELNGAGGEPTHIWDPRTRLREAYRAVFQQYRLIYEIGAMNRKRGFRPLTIWQLLRDSMEYRKFSRAYPLAH